MSDVSLQRISDFNHDLAALASIGCPIDLGPIGHQTVAETLAEINSVLKARVQRGRSIEQAIAESPELPASYRSALMTCLRCDDHTIALDAVTTHAVAKRHLGRDLSQAFVYPLILLTLAYFGFLYLCQITVPKIGGIYSQLSIAPSESLSLLTSGRELIPIWGPLVPVLMVLAIAWWHWRGSRHDWAWLPGSNKYYSSKRNAECARQMSRLVAGGMSTHESLLLAMPLIDPHSKHNNIASDGEPSDGAPSEGAAAAAENEPQVASSSVAHFPPLLRWAICGDLGGEPRARALQMVADTYRKSAARQATIWRVAVPSVCGVLLGGVLVLAYCLSVFYPVVALLKDITLPGGF